MADTSSPSGDPPSANSPGSQPRRASKRDPWEERERERERWANHVAGRTSSSGRSSRSRQAEPESLPGEDSFRENYLVWGLLAAVVALIAAEVPQIDGNFRSLLARGGGALLLLLAGTCRAFQEPVLRALGRGPNPFILLLVGWSAFSFVLAPFREVAAMELLRIVAGAAAFLLCAYALKAPRQISFAVAGLIAVGVLMSVYDFAALGQKQGGALRSLTTEYSAFGTHENVGSLLVLLLPPTLALALHPEIEDKRRLSAMAATLVLGGALLVARTRSAWLGGLVALVVLAIVTLRYGVKTDERGGRKRSGSLFSRLTNTPIFVIALGFVLFVAVGGVAPALMKRASGNILDDSSLAGRLIKWDGAARMVSEKPVTGWGLGSFVVLQGQWTHDGGEIAEVLQQGARHESIAHNYYAQWAADTGTVGLILHVACLTAVLLALIRGLASAREPYRFTLVCGTLAAVCGSLVDAVASPAYNFHGVYVLLWAWMGLGIAALRAPLGSGQTEALSALPPTPIRDRVIAVGCGIAVAGLLLGWGWRQTARGKTLARGTLQVVASPPRALRVGESVVLTANFTDENGKPINTIPGTTWQILGQPAQVSQAQVQLTATLDNNTRDLYHSTFRVLPPPAMDALQVRALYRDRYGRQYEAQVLKVIGNDKNLPLLLPPSSAP